MTMDSALTPAARFVAMCDRMSPDAQLAYIEDADGFRKVALTEIGVERLGELLADFEQLMNH